MFDVCFESSFVFFFIILAPGVNQPATVGEIPHFAFLPAFLQKRPAFLQKRPAFLALFQKQTKFGANSDNFQLHGDILWTEAVRKRTRCATALFSKPSDQIVNENLIVKAPFGTKCIYFCVSIDIREENRASCIFLSPC